MSLQDINEKIDLKRNQIAARHVVAATHLQAYEIEQQLIAKEGEELAQLLSLKDLAKARENAEAVGPQKARWG